MVQRADGAVVRAPERGHRAACACGWPAGSSRGAGRTHAVGSRACTTANGVASEQRASGVAGDDGLSYEQARAELAQIVAQLESGGQSLEESLALWTRGEELADRCQEWLDRGGARLEAALAASADEEAARARLPRSSTRATRDTV